MENNHSKIMMKLSIIKMINQYGFNNLFIDLRTTIDFYVESFFNEIENYSFFTESISSKIINYEVLFLKELLTDFSHDLYSLSPLTQPNLQIFGIKKVGDNHNKRRSSCLVITDKQNYLYKPRDIMDYRFFESLVDIFKSYNKCESITSFETIGMYRSDSTHHWEKQLIEEFPNQIEEVIQDVGMIFSLFVMLSTSDIHDDNYIFHRKGIFFYDLECIIGWMNLSYKEYIDSNLFTKHLLEKLNLIHKDFLVQDFVKGFELGLSIIYKERNQFLDVLKSYKNLKVRLLIRNTQEYMNSLIFGSKLSTSISINNWDIKGINYAEKEHLAIFDIPYFSFKINDTYFKDLNYKKYEYSNNVSAYERIKKRFKALDTKEIDKIKCIMVDHLIEL